MKKWHFAVSIVAAVAVAMAATPVLAGPERAASGPLADLLERVSKLETGQTELLGRVGDLELLQPAILERLRLLELNMGEY